MTAIRVNVDEVNEPVVFFTPVFLKPNEWLW